MLAYRQMAFRKGKASDVLLSRLGKGVEHGSTTDLQQQNLSLIRRHFTYMINEPEFVLFLPMWFML